MTGKERLQALRAHLAQMPDSAIVARLGDINQRGRAEAAITGLLVSAQECLGEKRPEWEPGIEAMLVDAAERWERAIC